MITLGSNGKLISSAKATAREQINKLVRVNGIKPFTKWEDIENCGVLVMGHYKLEPYSYFNFLKFIKNYEESAEARAIAAANAVKETPTVKVDFKALDHVQINLSGGFDLKPRQQKCIDLGVKTLFTDKSSTSILYPLEAGEGKSFIAAAMILHIQSLKYEGRAGAFAPLGEVLYLTKKPVVAKTIKTLAKLGVKDIGTKVIVMSYRTLSTKLYKNLFRDIEIDSFGNTVTVKQFALGPMFAPKYIILDECHELKKAGSTKTKYVRGFMFPGVKWIFTSATPGVTLQDMSLLLLTSSKRHGGEVINDTNITTVLRSFAQDIREPNAAAFDRLRKHFADMFIIPPKDPRKFKSTYKLTPINFRSQADREFYNKAEQDWIESVQRCGKDVSERGRTMAMFQVFRARAELIMVPHYIDRALEIVNSNRCALIGICYQDTLRDIVVGLVKRGIPRERISIVWGGEKEIKPEEVLSGPEFMALVEKITRGEELTRQEKTAFNKTSTYSKQRYKRNESKEDQITRTAELTELKLHKQTDEQREAEIERYLTGGSDICVFTFSSGGTGIDLDHQDPRSKPRSVVATMCYYAEEWIQALGRGYRLGTISNVEQEIPFFQGTIVADHVVPVLSRKIGSIGALTNSNQDLVSMLESKIQSGKLTFKEAADESAFKGIESDEVTAEDDDDEEDEAE